MVTVTQAVRRIDRGLGFLPAGHGQTTDIEQCLEEALRDLERGKTLPKFLLVEDHEMTLAQGESKLALPADFLRPDDDSPLSYVGIDSQLRHYLTQYRSYKDFVQAIQSTQRPDQPQQGADAPVAYILRGPDAAITGSEKGTIDFLVEANMDYDLMWNYYRTGGILDDDNLWLLNSPEWLIGEAGIRMAMDKRDQGAVQLFTSMMQKGRMATFADDRALEDAGGPIQMGANL